LFFVATFYGENMKRVFFILMAIASTCPAFADLIVRPAGGRIWQTNLKPDDSILWPWSDGADRARMTVTNLRTQVSSSHDISRANKETYGSYKLSCDDGDVEELYFLALEQYAGDKRLSRYEARVAVIPGVQGGGITVRSRRPSAQRAMTGGNVFAYDAQWAASYGVTELSLQWNNLKGLSGIIDLEGLSGYDVLNADEDVSMQVKLLMDGNIRYSRTVKNGITGLTILVR
jgi:hypothetical protein